MAVGDEEPELKGGKATQRVLSPALYQRPSFMPCHGASMSIFLNLEINIMIYIAYKYKNTYISCIGMGLDDKI